MLNWLKRRARITFQTRYTNILRRSNSPNMFLTEQSILNQQQTPIESIKLLLFNVDGDPYILDVPLEMTLDKVKLNAIGHFFGPLEATGANLSLKTKGNRETNRYRLILVRDYRTLPEERSVASEELLDNDEILLIECRKPNSDHPLIGQSQYVNSSLEDSVPTMEDIIKETAHVSCNNWNRQTDPITNTLDFKITLRQILVPMIEASIHLIAPEDNAADLFVLIFEHLEKRHKPKVDKNSLKQLTEMGFSEARSIKALQFKRNVLEAMEWLLVESNRPHKALEAESDVLLIPPERRRSFFMSGKDPAEKVMQEFKKYVEKWFVADTKALQNLVSIGYGEDLAKEALRITCNNEKLAKEFLEGNSSIGEDFQRAFDRDSPIMMAILESPIVQVALSKPKTLFALMVLCETPNNVNLWLSDPETHPVVSQVLRIYHLEKHRLRDNMKTNPTVTTNDTSSDRDQSQRTTANASSSPLGAASQPDSSDAGMFSIDADSPMSGVSSLPPCRVEEDSGSSSSSSTKPGSHCVLEPMKMDGEEDDDLDPNAV